MPGLPSLSQRLKAQSTMFWGMNRDFNLNSQSWSRRITCAHEITEACTVTWNPRLCWQALFGSSNVFSHLKTQPSKGKSISMPVLNHLQWRVIGLASEGIETNCKSQTNFISISLLRVWSNMKIVEDSEFCESLTSPWQWYSFMILQFCHGLLYVGKTHVWGKGCFDLCGWCTASFMAQNDSKSHLLLQSRYSTEAGSLKHIL